MKQSRFTAEQIVRILQEEGRTVGFGRSVGSTGSTDSHFLPWP